MAADVNDTAGLPKRALRFAARLNGEHELSFADLVNPPAWKETAKTNRNDLAVTMALLKARPAIDSELNGQKLANLADFVGEDRFDCVCEADISIFEWGAHDAQLPNPMELLEEGEALIVEAENRPEIGALAAIAVQVLRQEQLEPAE